MKLTKQYLRYLPAGKFNIITSSTCNVRFVKFNNKDDRYVATGAAEDVIVWDGRLGTKIHVFEGEKSNCLHLSACPDSEKIAAGYSDGTVIVYDPKSGENVTFCGHRSPISCISFDCNGHRIATGSKDTDIVVWDLIAESGLFRLADHKGPITQVRFMSSRDIIVSSSKDSLVKFWELSNGFCFWTIADHQHEVWDFCLMKNDSFIVTGGHDSMLRVWKISDNDDDSKSVDFKESDLNYGSPIKLTEMGVLMRGSGGRVISMTCDKSSQILSCHGKEKSIELFRFLSNEEVIRKYNKNQKKKRKRLKQTASELKDSSDTTIDSLKFLVNRLVTISTEAYVKHVDLWFDGDRIKIVSSLNNNSLAFYSMKLENVKEIVQEKVLTSAGHNSDVKAVAFACDSTGIISGSNTGLKVWNKETLACLRTIHTSPVSTVCFVPGDRYILAGMKSGNLLIVNIATGDIIESIDAHTDRLSSVSILPNKMGVITGGKDCTVKLWNLEFFHVDDTGSTSLTLIHTKTLQLDNPVYHVCVSPDSNLITTCVLDFTVKIFFMDTLKFFLCLTGHKMPITCSDISYDSTLIATGSDDRTVKIWGLDYGDCHKSLLAHEDNITGLKFVPKSHYFFTCAKDGKLKQWDADCFERILTIDAHRGPVWDLCISPNGNCVVSCGDDRVLRIYEKSDELLVLEDERETEREKEEETTLATGSESIFQGRSHLNLASRKTVTAEKGAELLLECVNVIKEYRKECSDYQVANKSRPPLPPIMMGLNENEYFLAVLRKIRTSDLEEILSLLSLVSAGELFELLLPLLQTPHNEIEAIVRIITFLIRAHFKPLVSTSKTSAVLKRLQISAMEKVDQLKNLIGCNLHGLLFIQREKETREEIKLFEEAIYLKNQAETKKRKKQSVVQTTVLKL